MTLHRVSVEGVEIAYEERGQGDRPLVLVHGYTGTWQDFEGQLDALSAGRRVLVPDLPGHGESARLPQGAYTLARLTELLVGWMDALALPPCDFLGHSMGGMIALRIALEHPDRLASLILMDTSHQALEGIPLALLDAASQIGQEAGMEKVAEILRARASEDTERSAADRRVEQEWGEERFWSWRDRRIAAMDPLAYAELGHAMAGTEDFSARLGEIRCPTLVMVGAQDTGFVGPSEVMAAGIPSAVLAVLPLASHQPQNENPDAWLRAIEEHLA